MMLCRSLSSFAIFHVIKQQVALPVPLSNPIPLLVLWSGAQSRAAQSSSRAATGLARPRAGARELLELFLLGVFGVDWDRQAQTQTILCSGLLWWFASCFHCYDQFSAWCGKLCPSNSKTETPNIIPVSTWAPAMGLALPCSSCAEEGN